MVRTSQPSILAWNIEMLNLTQAVGWRDFLEVAAEEGERLVSDDLREPRVRQDDGPQALQAVGGHQGGLHGKLGEGLQKRIISRF